MVAVTIFLLQNVIGKWAGSLPLASPRLLLLKIWDGFLNACIRSGGRQALDVGGSIVAVSEVSLKGLVSDLLCRFESARY
jgi:hypothetical protein